MSCTCISDAVKLVTDQLAEETPGSGPFYMRAEGHNLSLNIETGKAMRRFCVEVTGHYMAPKKAGGVKRVNKTVSVVANYCPLCGKACNADEQEETTSATSALTLTARCPAPHRWVHRSEFDVDESVESLALKNAF